MSLFNENHGRARVTMGFVVGATYYQFDFWSQIDEVTKVCHMRAPGPHDQLPIKIVDTKVRVGFPAWQYFIHVVTHC